MRIMQIVSFILCKGIKSSHIFHWNLHSFSCTSRCWTPPLEEKQFEVKLNIIYFGFERYLCKRRARRIPRTNIWWRTQECSQTRFSTYPQVEDINVCLKMKDFSLWWRSLSTSTLLRIFMDHCRKCHIFVRLSAQNTVLILYTSSKEHIAEETDTQEKSKIWKRGDPLFCKYFGPKNHFFVHK